MPMKRKKKQTGKNRFLDAKKKATQRPNKSKAPSTPKKSVKRKENPPKPKVEAVGEGEEIALNKYVALSGVCSRRKAVELIEQGLVSVNKKVVKIPYFRVQPNDTVIYEGKRIQPEITKQYILLNKPKNCITSHNDPEGRKTVLDVVKNACTERIFPVGRLDRNTTGLLLLTNDGDLAKKLSHPSHKVNKLYYATLDKPVLEDHINQILAGIDLEDGKVNADACGYVDNGDGYEVGIEIHLGKNRIVRRMFEHFGYQVKKLDRVYYAGLTKKNIGRGRWRHLTEKEIKMLKHFT